jgi:hypothetical protein
MRPYIRSLILRHAGRLLLGLALIGGFGVAMGGTSAAHAGGLFCGNPTISASGSRSYLGVTGQCFSPGGNVYVYVLDTWTQTSPTSGWAYAGTASPNTWNCHFGMCLVVFGGNVSYSASAPCGYGRLEVWAYDQTSGLETSGVMANCSIP